MPTTRILQAFSFDDEFKNKYWEVFLELVKKDKKFDFSMCRKGRNKKREIHSAAIRQIIKMYVNARLKYVNQALKAGYQETSNSTQHSPTISN